MIKKNQKSRQGARTLIAANLPILLSFISKTGTDKSFMLYCLNQVLILSIISNYTTLPVHSKFNINITPPRHH